MAIWFGIAAVTFFGASLKLIWPPRRRGTGLGEAWAAVIMLSIFVVILIHFGIASVFFLRAHIGAVPKLLVGAATLPLCFVLGSWACSWAWEKVSDPQNKRGQARLRNAHAAFAKMSPPELLAAI